MHVTHCHLRVEIRVKKTNQVKQRTVASPVESLILRVDAHDGHPSETQLGLPPLADRSVLGQSKLHRHRPAAIATPNLGAVKLCMCIHIGINPAWW